VIRVLVALALIAVVLIGADRLLAARGPRADHAPELVRVADLLRDGDKVVAGLSLDLELEKERHLYARSRGLWRCLSAWGAPCDGQRVEALVLGLLGARGVVLDRSGEQAASFGLDSAQVVEIALHGKALLDDPEGDELLRVRFAAADSPFARVSERPGVLELDFRPATALSRPAQGLPPLLDARIYPGVFPEQGRRVERLFVQRADGASFELVRRPREPQAQPDPAHPASALDWEWLLIEGERQVVISPLRGEAFVTWIPRAPYVALADPASAAERGLAQPRAKLTLVPDEGPTLELELGAALSEGGCWVRAPSVPLLARVDAQSAGMLLPELEELTDDGRDNRWDLALRQAMEQVAPR
jgi:hypothetical protein